jgi:hypothetical protein
MCHRPARPEFEPARAPAWHVDFVDFSRAAVPRGFQNGCHYIHIKLWVHPAARIAWVAPAAWRHALSLQPRPWLQREQHGGHRQAPAGTAQTHSPVWREQRQQRLKSAREQCGGAESSRSCEANALRRLRAVSDWSEQLSGQLCSATALHTSSLSLSLLRAASSATILSLLAGARPLSVDGVRAVRSRSLD